jgi:D-sedoheptulose 7-phosphate isomerase
MAMEETFFSRVNEFVDLVVEFKTQWHSQVAALANEISRIFMGGNKLLICGNGGSAADAQHFAAEFVSSFMMGLNRKALPAIALSTDSSILTAIGNDYGFDLVFSRQVEALGKPGDGLLAISTSGESPNCLKAAEEARKSRLSVLSLTRQSSTLEKISDFSLAVPSKNTQHIQECHLISYHIITELVENKISKGS